jgi:hypothetical protein
MDNRRIKEETQEAEICCQPGSVQNRLGNQAGGSQGSLPEVIDRHLTENITEEPRALAERTVRSTGKRQADEICGTRTGDAEAFDGQGQYEKVARGRSCGKR